MLYIVVTDKSRPDAFNHTFPKNGFNECRHAYSTSLPMCDVGTVGLYFTGRQRYDRRATKLHEIASYIVVVNRHLRCIASKRFRSAAKETSPVAVNQLQ